MARINDLVELVNTLLLSSIDNIDTVDKTTLTHIRNCVQHSQDTTEFLQLESQLQCDELQQNNQHFELVLVQNNVYLEFENHSYQRSAHNQISKNISKEISNENDAHVHLALPKPIIRAWEEIIHNKLRTGLRYNKEVTTHFPN